jgi:predicted transcriptional regulator
MLELSSVRKNKVNLADYNFQLDIDSRILLSDFSLFDLDVIEEILFNPLKISVKKLSRTLDCQESKLGPILQKLSKVGLVQVQDDTLLVDKERRKYFEFQISRFEEKFTPNMEFLQGHLKQVPIHILPTWYAIPRSSNNIFESIIEKYLLTPQIYQRYLMELNFSDPTMSGIMRDVFSSPEFRISSSDLIAKYNLARSDFEQIMLQLEFHFACFVTYSREDDHWNEWVTPIHEWREYLLFLQTTETPVLQATESICRHRENDFAFVEDIGTLLSLAKKKPFSIDRWQNNGSIPISTIRLLAPHCHILIDTPEKIAFAENYLSRVIDKLILIKLAEPVNGRLSPLDSADEWLEMDPENRALHLYRHSLNRLVNNTVAPNLCTERNLREAEKSIKRVLHGGWVLFDDFIRGAVVSFNEGSTVVLKKNGKHWKYVLPQYNDDEKKLIKAAIFDSLFECGIVATGTINGQDCLAVTAFGQYFLEE